MHLQLFTVKKLELHGSGAAHYSDTPHVVVSLASTSFAWSDQYAPKLRPLNLLLPDCILFSCCSSIASTSTAAPQLVLFAAAACALVHLLVITHTQYKA